MGSGPGGASAYFESEGLRRSAIALTNYLLGGDQIRVTLVETLAICAFTTRNFWPVALPDRPRLPYLKGLVPTWLAFPDCASSVVRPMTHSSTEWGHRPEYFHSHSGPLST